MLFIRKSLLKCIFNKSTKMTCDIIVSQLVVFIIILIAFTCLIYCLKIHNTIIINYSHEIILLFLIEIML